MWVEQMLGLGGDDFEFHNLRFQSRSWKEKGAPPVWRQAMLMWNNPMSRQRLRESVREFRPHALIFHNILPVGSFGLYEEAEQLGLPVLQYVHNFRPLSPSGTLWVRGALRDDAIRGNQWGEVLGGAWDGSVLRTALMAYCLKRWRVRSSGRQVNAWMAVSDFVARKLVEGNLPREKVVTLRHCWAPTQSEAGSFPEGDYYLFMGRIVPEKGLPTMLQAWRILEQSMGERCPRLLIAGTGPFEARVLAVAHRSSRVESVGFVSGEEKGRLLRHCRALIMPSIWWEPLGLTVYEAYDFARPVIASDSGGLTETVVPGRTGLQFPRGNAAGLAACVQEIEEAGPGRRSAMGAAGREWLESNASPSLWRGRLRAIAEEAIRTHLNR